MHHGAPWCDSRERERVGLAAGLTGFGGVIFSDLLYEKLALLRARARARARARRTRAARARVYARTRVRARPRTREDHENNPANPAN